MEIANSLVFTRPIPLSLRFNSAELSCISTLHVCCISLINKENCLSGRNIYFRTIGMCRHEIAMMKDILKKMKENMGERAHIVIYIQHFFRRCLNFRLIRFILSVFLRSNTALDLSTVWIGWFNFCVFHIYLAQSQDVPHLTSPHIRTHSVCYRFVSEKGVKITWKLSQRQCFIHYHIGETKFKTKNVYQNGRKLKILKRFVI